MAFLELVQQWLGLVDLQKALAVIWSLSVVAFFAMRRYLKDENVRDSAIQWIGNRPVKQWYQSTLRDALDWLKRDFDPQLFGISSFWVVTGFSGITALSFLLIGWVLGSSGNILGVDFLPAIDKAWLRWITFGCMLGIVIATFWLTRTSILFGALVTNLALGFLYFVDFQNGPVFGFGYAVCLLMFAAGLAGILSSGMFSQVSGEELGRLSIFFVVYAVLAAVVVARTWGSQAIESGKGAYLWVAVLFYLVIPVCTGIWSWISLGVTRFLGEQLLKNFRLRSVLLHFLADIVVAIVLLMVSGFATTLLIVLLAPDGVEIHAHVESILADPWGEGLWASLTMLISLVPSFLHIAYVIVPGLMFSWTSKMGKKLAVRLKERGCEELSRDMTSIYVVLPWGLGFTFTLIVAWDVNKIWNVVFPPLADLVQLSTRLALETGTLVSPWFIPFALALLISVPVIIVVWSLIELRKLRN